MFQVDRGQIVCSSVSSVASVVGSSQNLVIATPALHIGQSAAL